MPVPAPNNAESSELAEPTPTVSAMLGKKAARAAPMFALADLS